MAYNMVNIDYALKHFEKNFRSKKWKVSQFDLDCFNSISEYKEKQDSVNLQQNESLCKLWLNTIIMLNERTKGDFKRCLQQIDILLSLDINSSLERFKMNTYHMKSNVKLKDHKEYWKALDNNEVSKARKILGEVLDEKDLLELPDNDKLIKLVEREITRILNTYEK